MIEKIYEKKKSKKVIYENVRLSHTPNVFFAHTCLMQPIFHITGQNDASKIRNECLRRVLRLNAMF